MTEESKLPTHRVYAVTRTQKKSYWREIGAAWSHNDGAGLNVKLDLFPINGAELVIRKADDRTVEEDAPEERPDNATRGRAKSASPRP